MLLDWWLEHPNYEIYRGKNNEGVKKPHICHGLAKAMTEKTTSTGRTGEHVQLKIAHMEAAFRKTHEWSTGETGAGILECDGKLTWNEALTNMFEHCHDLLPIMGNRASSQPKFTNGNPSDLDADPDEEADAAAEDNGSVAEQPVPASDKPADKATNKPPSKKGRNRGNSGPSPLMDPKTLEMFELVSLASEGKLMEMEWHNAAVASNNAALLASATRKARAERMKNKHDCVKGRVALVAQHKELSDIQGLSDNQIVAFIPHLKDVVDMMNCEPAFMNRKRSAKDDDDEDNDEEEQLVCRHVQCQCFEPMKKLFFETHEQLCAATVLLSQRMDCLVQLISRLPQQIAMNGAIVFVNPFLLFLFTELNQHVVKNHCDINQTQDASHGFGIIRHLHLNGSQPGKVSLQNANAMFGTDLQLGQFRVKGFVIWLQQWTLGFPEQRHHEKTVA